MEAKFISFVIAVFSLSISFSAKAQTLSEDELEKANNPLADRKALNFQNYYAPSMYDGQALKANTFLIRYTMPVAKGKLILRLTTPLVTSPSGYNISGTPTYASGLGDVSLVASYILSKPGSKMLMGIGPQIAFPTANSRFTGTGKWQLGGSFILFNTASRILQWGSLITYQTSVAGQEDRRSVGSMAIQPFLLLQLGQGNYIRSSGIGNFNFAADSYNVPLGIGVGRVVKVSTLVMNIYLEPQFTVLHNGLGQPSLQVFGGINCQF